MLYQLVPLLLSARSSILFALVTSTGAVVTGAARTLCGLERKLYHYNGTQPQYAPGEITVNVAERSYGD